MKVVNLGGARVLIVEDEELISLVLQDMVEMLGCVVAGVAGTVEEARPLAANAGAYDIAILDVHLAGDPAYPIADAVVAADRPLVFATGSGRDGLPARFAGTTLLAKPYALPALEEALGDALAAR